ncbi:pregnancy-specific glycoprotein 22-like isoform X4 [Pelodiscus sinensis]|uniref:pregnancy-specific glycoprotein 22-like isoform X4 n=1 Tax=Pelodiscus sinensis TaxID=13735 RepID=UPI003F6C7FCE
MGRGPPRPGGPWARVLLAASVLGSCLQPAPAQSTRPPGTIVLSPPSPAVGGGVSLAPRDPPQNVLSCSWYRSATADEAGRILNYYPSAPSAPNIGPAHTGRETGGPGCALHIAGVTLSDTGNYSLLMEAPGNRVLAAVLLRVWASVLGSCLQPAPAQSTRPPGTIVLSPPSPAVGGGVSLAPRDPPQNAVTCGWYRSATTDEPGRILTYYPSAPSDPITGPAHTGRETGGPGCALHIAGVTLSDTGNYSLWMEAPPNRVLAAVLLRVWASVLGSCLQPAPAQSTRPPGTIVLSPPSPAVGGGVSLAPRDPPQNLLTCAWYRSATADEPGRILTYYPSEPSAPNIGPAHTGRETGGPGCALHIAGVTLSDTGNYSLLMEAPGNRVLAAVLLRVWEMLPRPTVTPNQTLVPENRTFSLTCNSSPSADTRLWLRDGEPLGPSRRLVLSPDNRTLTVLNVTRGDAGAYQCEVGNAVSSKRSEPSPVTVTYGPDSARIDPPGPILLPLGSPLTLTCVADSVPAPSYRWALNGTDTGQTGSSFTLTLTTSAQQGTYECQAHNSGTNLTAWASVAVRVPGPDPPPPDANLGLSAGAIVGIVIGSLAGVALAGVAAYFLYSRCQIEPPQAKAAPVLVYENLPPTACAGGAAPPRSPPDPGPTYETLQPRQPDVYEELK